MQEFNTLMFLMLCVRYMFTKHYLVQKKKKDSACLYQFCAASCRSGWGCLLPVPFLSLVYAQLSLQEGREILYNTSLFTGGHVVGETLVGGSFMVSRKI